MNRPDCLQQLMLLADCDPTSATARLQPALEKRLSPMVRLALRTGLGVPALVAWVNGARRHLAAGHDPDGCAEALTRWLSSELLRPRREGAATTAAWQTQLCG